MKTKIFSLSGFTLIFFCLIGISVAQTSEKSGVGAETYAYMFLAALLVTLAVLFASFMFFEAVERKQAKPKVKKIETAPVLEDHNYDGIVELDNPPPAWFQAIFYFTIIFAIVYMVNYHLAGKQNLMADEYVQEMSLAQTEKDALMKTGSLINEINVTLLSDPADIAKGKEVFTVNCVSCHGVKGEGGVGPNLTDDYWIHGCTIKEIFATISNGVPAKGMITWKTQLNPKQIQQVTSYINTLKGSNPPNGKAPEGVRCIDKTETSEKSDTVKRNKKDPVKTK